MKNHTYSIQMPTHPWAQSINRLLILFSVFALAGVFYVRSEVTDEVAPAPQSSAQATEPAAMQTTTVDDVAAKALAFKALLTSAQQTTLQKTYTTTLARKWSNLPCGAACRNGIQFGTLTTAQHIAAMAVVKAALSATAHEGAEEFHEMNIAEAYLHANGGGNGYDSTLRWISFLNNPSATGAWLLQFGGHHYAANIAYNNGHVIGATPFFMGLEPKTFTYQSVAYDPLGQEKNAFAAALASLSTAELSSAYIASSFSDCVMIPGESNNGTSNFPAVATGKALSSLTTSQQNLALNIIKLYVGDMDTATYKAVMAVYTSELSQTYISYHDNGTSGNPASFFTNQGDYGRISGPHVWIEFSCQGGIVIQGQIHYHTVWRDRSHDYGVDLTGPAIDNEVTSVSKKLETSPINIYPNPAIGRVSFSLGTNITNGTLMVISVATGQMVSRMQNVNGATFPYDASSLSSGSYMVRVEDKNTRFSGRFIKH